MVKYLDSNTGNVWWPLCSVLFLPAQPSGAQSMRPDRLQVNSWNLLERDFSSYGVYRTVHLIPKRSPSQVAEHVAPVLCIATRNATRLDVCGAGLCLCIRGFCSGLLQSAGAHGGGAVASAVPGPCGGTPVLPIMRA